MADKIECPLCRSFSPDDPGGEFPELVCLSCGRYSLTRSAWPGLTALDARAAIRLSWLARETSDAGSSIRLTTGNLTQYLKDAPDRTDPLISFDRLISVIAARSERADRHVNFPTTDFPAIRAFDANEAQFFIQSTTEQRYLEAAHSSFTNVRLTPKGWERALELRRVSRKSDQAFVAMSFDEELTEAWDEGLRLALIDSGYKAYRVDLEPHNDLIDDRIIAEIRRSGLVVADFTNDRPNVYYEAGFARGLGIPVITTCRHDWLDRLSFDAQHLNHVVWETPAELRERLLFRIGATAPHD